MLSVLSSILINSDIRSKAITTNNKLKNIPPFIIKNKVVGIRTNAEMMRFFKTELTCIIYFNLLQTFFPSKHNLLMQNVTLFYQSQAIIFLKNKIQNMLIAIIENYSNDIHH